eukprot:TRINITY_DN8329_c0_g1_i2.p1 TRINITY_DN8329_c0_g1~~TRINITY_DN8329_c0_g1_i2.p1  ORF type:complete len:318 (-),score=83.48 TRINITY_DN8329_c0_g1_i2:278-1231(-)
MTELKVMFLNAHLFYGTTAAFFSRGLVGNDMARARAICALVQREQPAVFGLAEVWGGPPRALITSTLAAHYNSWTPGSAMWWGVGMGSGLLLLTRKPLVPEDCQFTPFKELSGWDAWSCKGVASATVGGIRVLVTHTQAGASCRNATGSSLAASGTPLKCRKENLIKILGDIPAHESVPALLMGDFNISELSLDFAQRTQQYIRMSALFDCEHLVDAFRAVRPLACADAAALSAVPDEPDLFITNDAVRNELVRTFGNKRRTDRTRLDYIFVRGLRTVRAEVLSGAGVDDVPVGATGGKHTSVSDHQPVLCVFSTTP